MLYFSNIGTHSYKPLKSLACCWDIILDNYNLKGERFILFHGFRSFISWLADSKPKIVWWKCLRKNKTAMSWWPGNKERREEPAKDMYPSRSHFHWLNHLLNTEALALGGWRDSPYLSQKNFTLRTDFIVSHRFWYVILSLLFYSMILKICSLISSVTYLLFRKEFFNL